MQFLGGLMGGIGLLVTIVTLMIIAGKALLAGAVVGHQVAFEHRDRKAAHADAKEFVDSGRHGLSIALAIGMSLLVVGFFMVYTAISATMP